MITRKYTECEQRVQFLLTKDGLQIKHGNRKLVARNGEVPAAGFRWLAWGTPQCPNAMVDKCVSFIIVPVDDEGVQKYKI